MSMRRALALLSSTVVISASVAAEAADEPEVDAYARIVVDTAELRTGPGVSFRVIATARRGETFAIDGRQGGGFWLRVLLPDGRRAYAMGEQVEPFSVKDGEDKGVSRPGFFAPPPLAGAHAGLALMAGVLHIPIADGTTRWYGYVEARPQLVLDPTLSLEAFVGDGLTADGAQLIYGGGATIYLFPKWALCPFLGLGVGGLSVFPNADSFVLKRTDSFVARAGGGFLFALRNRILVRIEGSNMTIFTPETYANAQTITAGLGVYF
ncbi:hypothetical protein BH09MYX1_BH09MYX1_52020 [soil metagenome]